MATKNANTGFGTQLAEDIYVDGLYAPWSIPSAAATGGGAITAVPGASTDGTALGTLPEGCRGIRLYVPTGGSLTYTLASAPPGSAPSAVWTVTGPAVQDEPVSADQMVYVTAITGTCLFRWIR